MIKPPTIQQKSEEISKQIELKEKQTNTFNNFLNEINILRRKNPTPENIKNFAFDLKRIRDKLENSELSDEQFDIVEKQLFELLDFLEKENLKKEIDKKVKKIPKKPETIKKTTKTIQPPGQKSKPVKIIKKPEMPKMETRFPSIEISKPEPDIINFKKQLDKRIEDLKEIKIEETENEVFEYFIDEINNIIESTTFSFEDIDLKENYNSLKLLEKSLFLHKDKLSRDEYNLVKNEILKLGKYLQNLLREKGVKFKKDKAILKEETLKGRAKKYLREKKFESAGGLLFAITNSPLLMLLGKHVDDFLERRREEKKESEKEQIDKISEVYKKRPKSNKETKIKEIKKSPTKDMDVIEDTLFSQTPLPKADKELENDTEYQKMIADLNMFADESAKELDLSEKQKSEMERGLGDIPKNIERPYKYEDVEDNDYNEDEKTDIKRKKTLEKKEISSYDDIEEDEYDLLKKHIPSIDENIEKLVDKYYESNDEQKVTERDEALKDIASALEAKKEVKETDEKEITEKGIKGLLPHIGLIGKALAGVGAFGLGWMIGKQLDKWLGISKGIQNIVDKIWTLDYYQKKSLKRAMTKEQIEKTESTERLKEKLGVTRFTNRETYELLKKDQSILEKLSETERKIVLGKAEAFKKALKKEKPPSIKEKFQKLPEKTAITPEIKEIGKPEKNVDMAAMLGNIPEIKKPEKNVDMTAMLGNIPIINKIYNNYKTENIKKFEEEKSDDITNTDVTNVKTDKKIIDQSSVSAANKNVDIQNLDPNVKENLLSMATEYKEEEGKPLPINSAYRSTAKQAELYRKYPGKAARPGTSMHEKGLAIDINTTNVNELKSTGLLQKYGFHTPVKGETWHIEPTNIRKEYANVVKQETVPGMDMGTQQIGDAISEMEKSAITRKQENITNSNAVFAQNNYIVTPSDFRTFLDDPYLFREFRNDYS